MACRRIVKLRRGLLLWRWSDRRAQMIGFAQMTNGTPSCRTSGRKGHWESSEGNLTFDQVIERIARRAEELQTTRSDIRGLRVVAIDFRNPS